MLPETLSRRNFLASGAAAGSLLLAVDLPGILPRRTPATVPSAELFAPGVFLEISATGETTIWVAKSEIGQGVRTALPMILAEELDADWSRVRVRQGDADPKYGDQTTGGSMSISDNWMPLRKAGAQARTMLVAAAATRWGVPAPTAPPQTELCSTPPAVAGRATANWSPMRRHSRCLTHRA